MVAVPLLAERLGDGIANGSELIVRQDRRRAHSRDCFRQLHPTAAAGKIAALVHRQNLLHGYVPPGLRAKPTPTRTRKSIAPTAIRIRISVDGSGTTPNCIFWTAILPPGTPSLTRPRNNSTSWPAHSEMSRGADAVRIPSCTTSCVSHNSCVSP